MDGSHSGSPNLTAVAIADPGKQIIAMFFANGTQFLVPVADIDYFEYQRSTRAISYGSEIGASFMMLLVVLTMTPKTKFWRLPSYINIVSLSVNVIRTILLSMYFGSNWLMLYVMFAGDERDVTPSDYHVSVTATIFAIPQAVLVHSALMLQAWAMVKLWPDAQKWFALLISGLLTFVTIGFVVASQVIQIKSIYDYYLDLTNFQWIRQAALNLHVSSVCWFCFLFNLRLVIHLWTNRSFLPSSKGLSAMDILVMTNGILMLVPVIFAAVQFTPDLQIESGSLAYTSVVIILPLGTLVAQRTANPAAFDSDRGGLDGSTRITSDALASGGGNNNNNKKPLLRSWASDAYSPRKGSFGPRTEVSSTGTSGRRLTDEGLPMSSIDIELARIDGDDPEMGRGGGKGVRVDREIRHTEERFY